MNNVIRLSRLTLWPAAVVFLALVFAAQGQSRSGGREFQAAESVAFPETPAGSRAQQLFDLLNDKIPLEPKEFVRRYCSDGFKSQVPEPSWGGALGQIKSMAGAVALASVDKSEPLEISFTIRSIARGLAFVIGVSVEAKSPHLIDGIRLLPAAPGGGAPSPAPAAPKITAGGPNLDQINAFLAEQARLGRFSGTALIAKDGKSLLSYTAGMASKRFRSPNRIDTKFNLGSLNKSFTAVAVLQLAEAGKIGLDDPIGKYLDFFPKEVAEKVKVRHLLTMGSGWGDYWRHPYFLAHKDELRTVSQYMEFIKDIPLDFEPGTKTQHSNIGFEVAGALIEKVSGTDYFSYIRNRIYQPAGMADTDTFDRDSAVENLAVGYTNMHPENKNSDYRWENTYLLSPKGTPAGGGYATVEDMLKYDTALRAGKLVGRDYLNFMQNGYQGKVGDPFVPGRVLRGAGGANGVSAFYARDVRSGYTIIILTNLDNPAAIEIGNEIIKIMGLE